MVAIRHQLIGDTSMKFGKANPKKYLTIHETGNTNPTATAAAHANLQSRYWDWATWHWSVDELEAVQSYAHDFQLWHAGDGRGKGNLESIAIEICVNGNRAKARQNAAELAAKILKDEGIPLSQMVQHNHWSGKNCPMFIRTEGRWAEFVEMVRKILGGISPTPPSPKPPTPVKKTIDQLADMVYRGEYGNDPQRSARLRDEGYDPVAVQRRVNEKYYGASSPAPQPNIAQLADAVLRGDYGVNPVRQQKLGALYVPVQNEVNRRLGLPPIGTSPKPAATKTPRQLALEIINGVNGVNPWGNEPQRSQRLRSAGYDPVAVQREVNRLI